jgi:hypothetical protein
MFKKATLVLVLVGCTLATPTKASDDMYSWWALQYLKAAHESVNAGDWYNAYCNAEDGYAFADMAFEYSGSTEAYFAYYYAYYGAYYAWQAYVNGDLLDKEYADEYVWDAYYYAYYNYFYPDLPIPPYSDLPKP